MPQVIKEVVTMLFSVQINTKFKYKDEVYVM